MRIGSIAAMDELVLGPGISSGLPSGKIGIHERLLVLLDVIRGWISRGITSHRAVIAVLKLPYADPIECISRRCILGLKWWLELPIDPHLCGEQSRKLLEFYKSKASGHSRVDDDSHRLKRDRPLPNISIGTSSLTCHLPGFLITNIPGDVSLVARKVLESIALVLLTVVPVVIEDR